MSTAEFAEKVLGLKLFPAQKIFLNHMDQCGKIYMTEKCFRTPLGEVMLYAMAKSFMTEGNDD